ncbi:DUF3592 domain-containing protein [Breznakiellaceae bacterium SP9]
MNWGAFWGGFVFFAFALGTGFGWAYFIRQNAKMNRYSTAEGTLLSAAITSYMKSSRDSKGKSHTNTYYEPVMEYTYTVGGRQYTSASVIFGGGTYASTSRRAIEKMINHPVGGPITVFYNPDKPAESFLDKKASSNLGAMVVLAVFTICFGAIGIGAMVMGILGLGKPS